jgi:tripartite-type tricarboxylate transporter receptor subunit TctC
VHPSLPAGSVKELIALAKARPGQLSYASSGNGGPPHLAAELFKAMARVDIVHVPYKGGPAATNDVVGGQVPITFGTMLNVLPQVKAGKLRGLAVTSAKRSPALPELPTIAESGVPGYEVNAWYGVLAPAGTARDIVVKLNSEITAILRLAEVQARLASEGAEIVGGTPEQFASHIKTEVVKWAKVVSAARMAVD